MEKIVEICCGSYEDALNSYRGGAKRIELNSALHLGGLTPSLATLKLTKENTDLKVICMVRPRGAGFHYTDIEFEVMKYDAKLLMENGSDGLAFGFLDENGNIDIDQTKQMIDIVKAYHGEAVFHRAYDCVNNPYKAIETLIELGIDRVLTSGLEPKAMEGIELIKELQEKYGDRIEILAGSGINATNANELIEKTGIYQVHSSCKDWVNDPTTSCHHVSYSFALSPHENDYDVVSKELVEKIIKVL
ncbi:MAG: copper homeostasis protein CutC [Erysipelotrichales bacterium]|nr:copper homeostasis protein CutC [Erysipelotrichales bacterium]